MGFIVMDDMNEIPKIPDLYSFWPFPKKQLVTPDEIGFNDKGLVHDFDIFMLFDF